MNAYHKGLVGLAVIVVLIVLAVVAALMSGVGTTQGEVDARMRQCIEMAKNLGADTDNFIIRGCDNDADLYDSVDCVHYPNMPACAKIDEYYRARWG